MRTIPLVKPDLPPFEEIAPLFKEAFETGRLSNFGRHVADFEERAGAYLGCGTVTVSSGTAGLLLTLGALDLAPGKKVIVPSFTFMAMAQAVLFAGGVPVFAEIGDDLTLAPDDLESLLVRHGDVGAVVPVHTFGLPCQVGPIQEIVDAYARRHARSVPVVYDAAHAFGSALRDRKVGTFGAAEVFSLSVTKVLVSIEGGLIASRDAELLRRLKKMRNYGIEDRYDAGWPGLNGKMSELHAIVGDYNLRRIDRLLAERQKKARYFLRAIREQTGFVTLPWPEGVTHTFKDFTVLVPPALEKRRDAIMAFLKDRGIETRAYFCPPVHEQRYFRRFADRPLPVTTTMARRVITLPFYTSMTEADVDYIVASLAAAERSGR